MDRQKRHNNKGREPNGNDNNTRAKGDALREPKEGELIDIIDVTAITPNIEIKEPSNVKYLKARLSSVVLKVDLTWMMRGKSYQETQ